MTGVPGEAGGELRGERAEVAREAVTMVLYVSIVLLATLTALPADDEAHGTTQEGGVHGATLVAVVWGTALGLALAHWFAFRLAARLFGGGEGREIDGEIGLAQVGGAAVVAALCTIPIVLFDDDADVEAASVVPALIIGAAGYLIAHVAGRSRRFALLLGLISLVLGLLVATVKNVLLAH